MFLIGAALWITTATGAATPDVRDMLDRAERAGFTDPEAQNRDALAALDALRRSPDADLEIRARLMLCEYDSERDLRAAEQHMLQIQALLPRSRVPGLGAGLLTCRARILQIMGENDQALRLYGQAVDSAASAHSDLWLAAALYLRGYLEGVRGEYATGLVDLRRAQSLFDRLGRQDDVLSCRGSIATLYRRLGDNLEAAHLYSDTLRLLIKAGMAREQAVTYYDRGRTYEDLKQWDLAAADFSQALELAQQLRYQRVAAYALRGLAAVRVARGDADGALALLRRAGVLHALAADARLGAQIDLEQGRALRLAQRLPESLAALQRARSVFQTGASTPEFVTTEGEIAQVEAALGEWRAAYTDQAAAAVQEEQLLSHHLDERFAILKVEYDSAAQEQENRSLLRENAATGIALAQSRRVRQLQAVVIGLGVALGAVLTWLLILNRGRARHLGSLALTDELTQVPNRRAVIAHLALLLKRPEPTPCAMLIMDIDFFKRVNDQYGHAAGDEVLKLVAAAVRSTVAPPAFFGRLGGEEFLIVVPDADLAVARQYAENLRACVAAIDTSGVIAGHAGVTTSVGLTLSQPGGDDPSSMLARADTALYAAKRSGRNCVRTEPVPQEPHGSAAAQATQAGPSGP